ncbi:methyl-accepting chemotaxis protein [Dyella sp. BiH032]|uniref:methyl-accepting chemotaxis protein n=1 Tax=Dyella sp. BiH032 TaxID=3075430 RepID=UPI0028937F48|nr:methyl-accepting chemotaxis protein [Dyella sp. BiH032]WNL45733.1 methyl-accepting chemotaxis protein [Dyella sp. BiH032]
MSAKRFTVRARLASAFGLLTLLVLATAVAGGWGILGLNRTAVATLQGDVRFSTVIRRVQADLLELRRFEKDSFINIGDTDAVASYHGKWTQVHDRTLRDLDAMRAFPAGTASADRFAGHLKTYTEGYEGAMARVAAHTLASTRDANTFFTQFKDSIRALDDLSAALAAEADRRVDGIEPQLHARAITAMSVSGIAVIGAIAIAVLLSVLTTRRIMTPLMRARGLATAISEGHLANALQVEGNDEFADTLRALQTMDGKLAAMVGDVRIVAEQVAAAARDISAGNDHLSNRTQEQAASIEETAASMEQMTATVSRNAEGAEQARELTQAVRKDAERGGEVAHEAMDAMHGIHRASGDIAQIIALMDEIAFQTNLLALNAAVEAASAGPHGRGFAVVAAEVRALAQRSAAAAKDIKRLITDSGEKVTQGVELVGRASQALQGIRAGVRNVNGIVEEIAAASQEQTQGIHQVNTAIATIDSVTQQNAALVEEASSASRTALELAQSLLQQVAFFKIRQAA